MPDPDELVSRREAGRKAAEGGVSLRALINLYLSVTTAVWRELVRGGESLVPSEVRLDVEAGFRAVDDAVVALTEGYEGAHQLALREEEAARREFIEDLFCGRGDLGRLAARAQRFGLRLAEAHVVSVARAERPFGEATPITHRVESALSGRYGTRDLLVITKDEMLVCIAPSTLPEASGELARQVGAAVGASRSWQVGIGREHLASFRRAVFRSRGDGPVR
ncbi:hypothetical protein E1181_27500 [Saccharopolyspora terrae]|uniref:Uncharacterized protein n=1 Tax=Saccharopolyspora terrae TaxID=2530384 RepID=A0A4V2Y9M4_9PSEU|nr:hypothetical protein [Saccharopolyspora terrae]TDD00486.1 hypothetical protein E1181_27500 [Saccharopolyspora terrae]